MDKNVRCKRCGAELGNVETDTCYPCWQIERLEKRIAELERRWIPVSERLPELEPGNITKTIRVLCTYIRYDVRVVFESVWDEEREHFYWDYAADYPATFSAPDFTNGNERIIAWQYMPRPALPEEVEG